MSWYRTLLNGEEAQNTVLLDSAGNLIDSSNPLPMEIVGTSFSIDASEINLGSMTIKNSDDHELDITSDGKLHVICDPYVITNTVLIDANGGSGSSAGVTNSALDVNLKDNTIIVDDSTAFIHSTGSGAISASTSFSENWILDTITIHFSATPSVGATFYIRLDSGSGAVYDTILYETDINSKQDIALSFGSEYRFAATDVITVTCSNTESLTYGLRIVGHGVSGL